MPDVLGYILLSAFSFVLVLSVVVFVHELGHFQVARWRGVAIDTFSIGFGKTLLGWRDKQGVQWKVGALPLGGYVKFADDADAMSTGPRDKIDDPQAMAEARAKGLFHAQPLSTRAMVVAAGPLTNFVFSILAFAAIALIMGRDATDYSSIPARIAAVAENSPAAAAGLRPGDVVLSIDGRAIGNFTEFQAAVAAAPEQALTFEIVRDGAQSTITATPRREGARGLLGVYGPLVLASEKRIEPYGPLSAIGVGAANTWDIVAKTGAYIGAIFAGRESGDQIAGPLGIFNVSGQVASGALNGGAGDSGGFASRLGLLALSLLSLAAVLSVAVGIVNLLPIPILDGGHLLFYAIEGARGGKPLPAVAQEWAYRAGFAVMASLFLFATWNDITRLLPGAQ